MTTGGKRGQVPATAAPIYAAKAREFMTHARNALVAGDHDAALLNAVHAGISACDAVTSRLAGVRSTDPDHQRAADLLEEIVRPSEDAGLHARQLRMLVSKKNLVEYEARRATASEADEGVERASRLVDWAERIVEPPTRL